MNLICISVGLLDLPPPCRCRRCCGSHSRGRSTWASACCPARRCAGPGRPLPGGDRFPFYSKPNPHSKQRAPVRRFIICSCVWQRWHYRDSTCPDYLSELSLNNARCGVCTRRLGLFTRSSSATVNHWGRGWLGGILKCLGLLENASIKASVTSSEFLFVKSYYFVFVMTHLENNPVSNRNHW